MNNINFEVVLQNGHTYEVKLNDCNQHWVVWLSGDEDSDYRVTKNGKLLAETRLFWIICGQDTLGFWHYGAVQKEEDKFHEAGYMWSSRSSVMNAYMEHHICDVYLNRCSAAISLEDLRLICKAASKVAEELDFAIDVERDDNGEVTYYIVSANYEEHDIHELLGKEE